MSSFRSIARASCIAAILVPWAFGSENDTPNGAEKAPDAAARTTAPAEAPPPKPGLLPDAWMEQLEWRSIGPANMGGRIVALAVVESDPATWWVATASGGLLKTTNDGMTFEHQFDREATVSIGDVAVAPSDPEVVWVGTGESNPRNSVSYGDGVYKSTDGGETWTHMGLERTFQTGRIAIHPDDPDVVYVGALGRLWGTNEERGLFKTTDGGETWKKVLTVDEKTGVGDVALRPGAPDTLIVATYERQRDAFDTNDPAKRWGPGSALWRTEDGGASWTKLVDGLPTCDLGRIDVDFWRKDPDVVFAIVESSRIGEEPEDAPYVGVRGEDADVGARLTEVVEDGPAAQAGLEAGDIVVALEEEIVHSYDDFIAKVRRHLAGETVLVEVSRDRKSARMELTFARRPGAKEDAQGKEREEREEGEGEEEGAGEEPRAPFRTSLGGQVANVHEQQGPDGHEYGGVYRSDDGGTTWRRINSINPRPMYFSLIRVDPSDDRRLVVGGIRLHRSNDGGETFTDDGHGREVHVDHHALWIDPDDGRHMILGNDGGVYVTRDRMETWDHLNHAAIGQFYHVTVGPRRDYKVYGGLQDNGTWGGPSRGPTGEGPINEDWISVGGGDGFQVRVDPADPDQVYFESQNGGLGRVNFRTGDRAFMRPRPPRGERYRFNWQTPFLLSAHNSGVYYTAGNRVFRSWFKGDGLEPISPEIARTDRGAATALAESALDADVLYVGTDDGAMWRTKDGGRSWDDLFEVEAPRPKTAASGAEKRDPNDPLTGRWIARPPEDSERGRPGRGRPGGRRRGGGDEETVLDLKLGEEGRVTMTMQSRMGELEAAGTFDAASGALALEADRGDFRMTVSAKVEGDVLKGEIDFGGRFQRPFEAARAGSEAAKEEVVGDPISELVGERMGVASLEASRFEEGRVYLAIDGHRSDDDRPHAFVSEDHGTTWTSLTANLPAAAGSSRVLREDLFDPEVLYLGCEFGLWVSIDRGETWTSMKSNLPTVAVHEVAQHPTAGEIVAGTHGRSLWVLDVTPLRQVTAETLAADAHLYAPNTVVYFERTPRRGGTVRRFEGTNDREEAELFYSLGRDARRVELEVRAPDGEVLAALDDEPTEAGLHRLTWDLRRAPDGDGGRRRRGPRVAPGTYTVALTVGNRTVTAPLVVENDPSRPDAALFGEEYDRRLEWEERAFGGDEEEEDGGAGGLRDRVW